MENVQYYINYIVTTVTRSWGKQPQDNTDKPSDNQINKDTEQ